MEAVIGGAGAAPAPGSPVHSPYGASGAHRWTVCHGSIRAQEGKPDDKSPYAQEGTAGHAVAATCLESGQDAIEFAGRVVEEVEIDESVVEAVQVYLDTIREDQAQRGGKLLVETKFHLSHLHPLFYGTADCTRLGTDCILSVYDLKLGRGKIVEVRSKDGKPNIQAGYYGIGALHALARLVQQLGITHVELVIVQPRAWHKDGPVRRATFTVAEIEALGPMLVAAAAECAKPDATLVPGDHCTFCKAAGTCPALRQLAFDTAQLDWDDVEGVTYGGIGDKTLNPVTTDSATISRVLTTIEDVIEPWISAVKFHAHLLAGTPAGFPGYKLVDRQARRKWADAEKAAAELCLGFGLDEGSIYDKKLLSPAQVEKKLPPAERKSEAFKALCPAISSGSTLVRLDNPKPERKPTERDFDDGLSTDENAEW